MADGRAGEAGRVLPWLLIPLSLLSNPAAALPFETYFFRDFTITLLPLRLMAAREWAAGRWPAWNPYLHEGSVLLPAFYPGDLLHALWPDPRFVSWLLTLHLPLAALAAYRLARDLGAGRSAAFVAGGIYSLGGYAASALNLYYFLQALAWVPLVAAMLRRAALLGGRWIPLAGLVAGVSFGTLAFEFLSQGVVLGVGLALLERRERRHLLRLGWALALAAGLAALPVALTLGILPETARGQGFLAGDALEGELPPLALLQTFVLGLFGPPASPFEGWWGPFFRKGAAYFLSIYLGPTALALAASGVAALHARRRALLLAGLLLGVWFATGAAGGLAPLLLSLPGFRWFRTPSKAFLFPYLALALFCGFGFERLRARRGWTVFLWAVGGLAAVAAAVAALLTTAPDAVAGRIGLTAAQIAAIAPRVAQQALESLALSLAGLTVGAAVVRGRLRAAPATALLAMVALVDLLRAAAGINAQVPVSFFELRSEIAAAIRPDGRPARVFSYGLQSSPAFREQLARSPRRPSAWVFQVDRQLLSPYTNILDGIESAETPDLTGFGPVFPELVAADYDPAAVARILPRLRSAGVERVLSLDPLAHDALRLAATAPLPATSLAVHVYALEDALPAQGLACRGVAAAGPESAFRVALAPGFDPVRAVAVEGPALQGSDDCAPGTVTPAERTPARETYLTASDAPGYLLVRRGFARGWSASVDGSPAPLYRANGRHRAVPLAPGRHRVELRYRPPGRGVGLALVALAAAFTAGAWLRPPSSEPAPSAAAGAA